MLTWLTTYIYLSSGPGAYMAACQNPPAMPMASGLVIAFEIPEHDFMNCASRPRLAQGAQAAPEPRQSRAHPCPDHAHTRLGFTTCSCRLSRPRGVLLSLKFHPQAILSEPQHPPGPTLGRPGVPSIAQHLNVSAVRCREKGHAARARNAAMCVACSDRALRASLKACVCGF